MDRARSNTRERQKTLDAQEIGPVPAIENRARRELTSKSLERFLKIYFPWAFPWEWADDHLRVIAKIEAAIIGGGLFAMAMPRASGKTSICARAAIWAILTGRRKFVSLIGATENLAAKILESQMTELRHNDFLLADFPEACFPIRALDNEARRCKGQKCLGRSTDMIWKPTEFVFPTIPRRFSSACRGSIITVAGLTGAVRGAAHTTVDGRILRPSFVLIDDPQTRESAESESQSATREAIIAGDILGMAGPGQSISAVMPCTVIRRGDMCDRMLDRTKHPDWNGERTKMLVSLPRNEGAIEKYGALWAQLHAEERGLGAANRYWRKHQDELEDGAEAAWPARKLKGEVSAIQHAINLMLRDRPAFFAEYQNEPIEERGPAVARSLTAEEICKATTGIERGNAAAEWSHVTAAIDVQKDVLFWAVCGWAEDFSGGVIDYGAFPDQGRNYFTLRDVSARLGNRYAGYPPEAAIYAGLRDLTADLCGRRFPRPGGVELAIERLFIDEGYETDVVFQFCQRSEFSAIAIPAKGWGIRAGNRPMNEYKPAQGDIVGIHCRVCAADGRKSRHVLIDTNYWKSFVFARLATPAGAAGSLGLYGTIPDRHRMLADHLKAEYCVETFGRGRAVTEWSARPGRPDNHWLDCLTGATCAASLLKCTLTGQPLAGFAPKKRVSFAAQQAQRRR
jgi:hypothetical protein